MAETEQFEIMRKCQFSDLNTVGSHQSKHPYWEANNVYSFLMVAFKQGSSISEPSDLCADYLLELHLQSLQDVKDIMQGFIATYSMIVLNTDKSPQPPSLTRCFSLTHIHSLSYFCFLTFESRWIRDCFCHAISDIASVSWYWMLNSCLHTGRQVLTNQLNLNCFMCSTSLTLWYNATDVTKNALKYALLCANCHCFHMVKLYLQWEQ